MNTGHFLELTDVIINTKYISSIVKEEKRYMIIAHFPLMYGIFACCFGVCIPHSQTITIDKNNDPENYRLMEKWMKNR